MAYTIPSGVRTRWQRMAQQAGLPYATIVGQQVYDIHNEIDTLTEALKTAQQAQAAAKIQSLTAQLAHCQEQLAAYEGEQRAAG
jgi:hypothetical protein